MPLCLPPVAQARGAESTRASPDGPRVTAQAGGAGTPEAGPLAEARVSGAGLHGDINTHPFRATSGAASPAPNDRRSAARVLAGEG